VSDRASHFRLLVSGGQRTIPEKGSDMEDESKETPRVTEHVELSEVVQVRESQGGAKPVYLVKPDRWTIPPPEPSGEPAKPAAGGDTPARKQAGDE